MSRLLIGWYDTSGCHILRILSTLITHFSEVEQAPQINRDGVDVVLLTRIQSHSALIAHWCCLRKRQHKIIFNIQSERAAIGLTYRPRLSEACRGASECRFSFWVNQVKAVRWRSLPLYLSSAGVIFSSPSLLVAWKSFPAPFRSAWKITLTLMMKGRQRSFYLRAWALLAEVLTLNHKDIDNECSWSTQRCHCYRRFDLC